MADRFNPDTPQWLRDANLSVRVCNVLTANGIAAEAALRKLLAYDLRRLRKVHGLGRKSMHELLEWARETPPQSCDDTPRPDRTEQLAQADRIRAEFLGSFIRAQPHQSPRAFEVLARTGTCSVQVVLDALDAASLVIVESGRKP